MSSIFLFILGFIYANFIEVFAHSFVLHKLGKKKNSIFSFHWKRHHQVSRINSMVDFDYKNSWYSKERIPEVFSLMLLIAIHVPLYFFAPTALIGMTVYLIVYYNIHKFCHLNSTNAKKWFKGHYLHHMGSNQDMNWGTIMPLADFVIGTSYLNKKNKNENRDKKAKSG